ncbi:MAG: BREX-1 system phosphatase PglZ type A [Spirochaetales bacterium]|nr:BREX-1 system phosphatase PglZ type A [Spirochaetales bacterium]
MRIDIEQTLRDRFAAPLQDNYDRRIIFWQDPDGEFAAFVDELRLDGVKILKLTGNNNFAAKQILSHTDTKSNYLVYNPLSYPDIRDNWLLDIELYSEEFRADLLSIRMQELNMPASVQLRKILRSYTHFFENKERMARLKALNSNYSKAGQLHIDIMAVLAGTSANTVSGVIRAVLMNGLDIESNEAITNIRKFGHEDVLWEMINRYTGYTYEEGTSLITLASHILLATLSVTMETSCLQGPEKLISESHRQFCYSLINEWDHSEDDDELYDIARAVEEHHHLEKHFDALDVADLLNSECFPCINECILRRYMSEISDNIIKADDMVAAIEKRRTLRWYKRVRYYYDGLLQVAQMQQFYQANIGGFHVAEYAKLWKEYTGNYYKMDQFYRQFHVAFGKSLKETSTVLEDLYKNVADYVEKLYKNWYLATLGNQWTMLVSDELEKSAALAGIAQQADFYRSYVKPIVTSGSRAYVIISDALRYEVAAELTSQLLKETKGRAKISAMQSAFPSATKFGMAALLPHKKLQLTDDIRVLCDGEATDSTAAREKILKAAYPGNVALTYKDLIAMKQAERREKVSGANVVYIYHNAIDAVGDKATTEDQVFDACDGAVVEIKKLVRLITNDLSGTNILITADHGFLYSYKPLEESDKAEKSFVSGDILELDRRYVIADGDCTAEHMLKIPLTHLNSRHSGFTPLDYIRMKKQGGGMNYVHGGISLQECVVPVIEFKNIRATSKKFVDVKKAELQLISQSRKISNSIFSLDFYQKEPVSGKTAAATYEIYMADADGQAVSDKKTIIADKTSNNGADRVFRERFTLKSVEFKKTDDYYLTVVEKGTTNVSERIGFTIDIAFVNDFDL